MKAVVNKRSRATQRSGAYVPLSGSEVECDFAVVGIGVAPRVELARDAGLPIDNGIVVDERLRTSVPNVFAAGDVTNVWHPFYERRIRVEHWANALNQRPAAAWAMLDGGIRTDPDTPLESLIDQLTTGS